ncbi:PREDICTED: uncharacterized protein LOC106819771 [Priapulus caudatus]|uniref:Uncharacterized protein LOC106819771 n=1 Tax=Priapulus caudatus TaxID=37621 RepID=A0ABM1F5X4_PRICU|nr:PREDICTED: uncharacterized protein LOC106819771 [Priapulus caudatus]
MQHKKLKMSRIRKDSRRKIRSTSRPLAAFEICEVERKVREVNPHDLELHVTTSVSGELHMQYGERLALWGWLTKTDGQDSRLSSILAQVIVVYATLLKLCFQRCAPGDRYSAFHLMWQAIFNRVLGYENITLGPAIDETIGLELKNVWWMNIGEYFNHPMTESHHDDMMAVVHSVASASLQHLSIVVKAVATSMEAEDMEVREQHEETEYGLFAVAGGCIQRIKQQLWKRPLRQRRATRPLLDILFACVKTKEQKQGASIPHGLALRDRGGLLIPQRVMLPWLRKVDRTVRTNASERGLTAHGRNLIKATVQQVFISKEIEDLFLAGAIYACQMKGVKPKTSLLKELHGMWLRKIVHARVNEFIVGHQLREADKQGLLLTSGGFTLRDELYSVASKVTV